MSDVEAQMPKEIRMAKALRLSMFVISYGGCPRR
jgi:hypothetical protein